MGSKGAVRSEVLRGVPQEQPVHRVGVLRLCSLRREARRVLAQGDGRPVHGHRPGARTLRSLDRGNSRPAAAAGVQRHSCRGCGERGAPGARDGVWTHPAASSPKVAQGGRVGGGLARSARRLHRLHFLPRRARPEALGQPGVAGHLLGRPVGSTVRAAAGRPLGAGRAPQHGPKSRVCSHRCRHPTPQRSTRLLRATLWAREESPRRLDAEERLRWRSNALSKVATSLAAFDDPGPSPGRRERTTLSCGGAWWRGLAALAALPSSSP